MSRFLLIRLRCSGGVWGGVFGVLFGWHRCVFQTYYRMIVRHCILVNMLSRWKRKISQKCTENSATQATKSRPRKGKHTVNYLPDGIPKRETNDNTHKTKQVLIALNSIKGANVIVHAGISYGQLYGPGKALGADYKLCLRPRIQNHVRQRFFACRNFRHQK